MGDWSLWTVAADPKLKCAKCRAAIPVGERMLAVVVDGITSWRCAACGLLVKPSQS